MRVTTSRRRAPSLKNNFFSVSDRELSDKASRILSDSKQAVSGWPFLFPAFLAACLLSILAESRKNAGNAGLRRPAILCCADSPNFAAG